jgi:hypothetical protein
MHRELLRLIEDVAAATARYHTVDDRGHSMDTLKVVENPAGGYLGVYHSVAGDGFAAHLATSADLLTWTHRAVLDAPASQPTVAAVPGGGFLVAVEAGGSGQPAWLRFSRYRDVDRLLAADPDRVFDAPHTQVPPGRLAEGTPNIYAADDSVVDAGFHYFRDGDVDRQARGRLTGFRTWTTERRPRLDAAVEAYGVAGNIGDRDALTWRGSPYTLIEGQLRKGRWDSWRIFLYEEPAGPAYPVRIRTHGGSTSFGNPSATLLTAPSGAPALLVSVFLFGEGAAPGEAGQLVYHRETPDVSPPAPSGR